MKHRRLPIVLVALLATACHTTKPVTGVPTLPEPEPAPAVVEPYAPREMMVLNFTANVEGISVNGQLRMAQDSVLWVSVNKVLELGRAMATPDSVWVNAPLADKHFAGDYTDVSRRAKSDVTYAKLQAIACADDAEQQIERLARQLGFTAKVHITRRQKVDRVSFPFTKP